MNLAGALRFVVLQLLDPETSLLVPESRTVETAQSWSPEARDFLMATESTSVDDLEKHMFLKKSPGACCLRPLVTIALHVIDRNSRPLV
jgi:hypothetical protein